MIARYAGTCYKCHGTINRGEEITWNRIKKGEVCHLSCSGAASASFKASVEAEHNETRNNVNETWDMSATASQEEINATRHYVTVDSDVKSNGYHVLPQDKQDLASIIAASISSYLPASPAQTIDESAVNYLIDLKQHELRKELETEILKLVCDNSREIVIKNFETNETKNIGLQHKQFPKLLKFLQCRLNVWITGPAGSGKTTAAENAAEALGLTFYFCGAQSNEYGLLGYKTATGDLVRTPFREAYEHGGVFLFDEVDASSPSALLAFNAALANNLCAFPDGMVHKHADFIVVAAANTWGLGATNDYVGRMKQDAAFLDRFIALSWEYDNDLESSTCGNAKWAKRVQQIRSKVRTKGIKVIISPRASYFGAKLLAAGEDQETVELDVLRKGMTEEQWDSVR